MRYRYGLALVVLALAFLLIAARSSEEATPPSVNTAIAVPQVAPTPEPRCYGLADLAALIEAYGCTQNYACYNPTVDYDNSGRVDSLDLTILHRRYGQCYGDALPWLETVGGRIVRGDTGAPVELRGVNLLRNEWVYPSMDYERLAIPQLASVWHANIITHGFASDPVVAGDAQYLAVLDEYQRLAEQNHMYIIFAYYYPSINGDQPPYPGVDPNWQTALVALTQRYRTKSNVLFMLQAEPHSDFWPGYPNGESYRVTWNCTDGTGYDHYVALRPLYDQAITAMRAVDNPGATAHIILGSGDGYGRDISPVVTDEYGCHNGTGDPIQNSNNFVYSSHPYDTRAGSNDWDYFLPVARAGYPVLVTEFGTGGQMNEADTEALVSEMNSGGLHIGWTAWIFDDSGCPCLLSNRLTFTPSSPYGQFIKGRTLAEATRFP